MKRNRTIRTFTLIELLVILSMITVLSTLLIQVLNKALEGIGQTHCASNQSNLGTSFILYSNDNNGLLPYTAHSSEANQWYASNGVLPYVFHGETITHWSHRKILVDTIFNCPVSTGHPDWGHGQIYGYNASLNPGTGTEWESGLQPSRRLIKTPSEAAMLVETYDTANNYWAHRAYRGDWLTSHHDGGGNFLFVDGRVKWMHRDDDPPRTDYFWDAYDE
jgi:prepilin-type processing-associated H-X9-DG protein